ncbi:MAG: hypothetical protein JJT96_09295 [Opitutales bacterium]|nr:hypothetical protein [Opitutales bacterium]
MKIPCSDLPRLPVSNFLACAGLFFSGLALSSASVLDWNPSGGGTPLGGAGAWNLSNTFWWDGSANVQWLNDGSATARLTGSSGTVNVQGSMSVAGLDLVPGGPIVYIDQSNLGNAWRIESTGDITGGGTIRFHSNALSGGVRYSDTLMDVGLRFTGGAPIAVDADFRGLNLNSSSIITVRGAGTKVTYNGFWEGDGGNMFAHVFLREGGHFVIGEDAHLDFVNNAYFTRQLWVSGDGAGAIEFAEGFVADLTQGGTVPDGLGSIRLNNATVITNHTQNIPVNFRPRPGDVPQTNGHFVFETNPGSRWIVQTNPQSYAGGVWIRADGTIETREDLTHTGVREDDTTSSFPYRAGNAFQTNVDNLTITKEGPASLILEGEQAYRPGTVIRVNEGTVVFASDPAAGTFHNGISQAVAGAGPDLNVEVRWTNRTGVSLPYSNFNAGRAEFTAPFAHLNSIDNFEGYVVIAGEVLLEGAFTQNHQEFIGSTARPNRILSPEAGYLVFRLGAQETVALDVSGTATLGGFLQIEREEGFRPAPGTQFDIILYGSRSGQFAALNDFSDLGVVVEYLSDRVRLTTTREAGRTGVVVDEDFTTGQFNNPDWRLLNNPSQVGFFAPSIDRPGIPQALVHRVDHPTFTWGVAFLDTPTFRIGEDEVLVQKMTTFSDVARGNAQYYKIEIAALHADTHAPFGHNRSAELSRNYSTQAGNQWQIFPSLYNDDVTRVPFAHHSGGSTSSTLLNADNSMLIFRPIGDGSTTRVEALGANQINPNLTIPFPLEHWNTLQISMPRQWAGTDNVLATGATRANAQMGMSFVHVGVTHRTDATVDYVTDAADFIVWNSFRGQTGTHLQTGDFTNDGTTGMADLALLAQHLGTVHDPDFRRSLRYETLTLPGTGTPPEFVYDSSTGHLTLFPNGSAISAWQIPGPAADVALTPLSGDWWTDYVAGQQQWVDLDLDGVSGSVLIGFYPTGLTADDFGDVFFGYASGGGDYVPVTIEGPSPAVTVLLDDNFSDLSNWQDLSTAVNWTGSPPSGSVFRITDGVLNLNDEARTANMWNNPGGIRSFSAIDYQFPSSVTRPNNTITVEFRLRWASLSATGENSRVAFMLLHDYPEGGLDLTPEARVMDFSQQWWARPAYQVRIRGGFNPPDAASYFMYGGGRDIEGEFETAGNPAFWLPGFVSGAGGVVPGTSPSFNFPLNGWWMSTTAPASTTFKRYRYVVLPESQQLWVNHNDDGETWVLDMEMPLPFEEDAPTDPAPPLYRYFDQIEGLRIYFRGSGAGASAPNAFLDYVTITVEGDYVLPEPPADLYAAWGNRWFGADFGDPATEATLWGPDANPANDGISNALKAFLGLSPLERMPAGFLEMVRAPDGSGLFDFSINADLASAAWRIETSGDLSPGSWTPAPSGWLQILESHVDRTDYRATVPTSAGSVFVRLRFDP